MADTFNYRIDHHGSLIRPATLLTARAAGDTEALAEAELEAVKEAVAYQRRLRTTVVTDGDFPREDFRSAVFDGVSGFRRTDEKTPTACPAGWRSPCRRPTARCWPTGPAGSPS